KPEARGAISRGLAADPGDMPDHVGFPVDYQTTYQVLRTANKPKPKLFATQRSQNFFFRLLRKKKT
ncbi:MAG: hypothetical protein V4692_15990, partial [Bdellovibrionota bacterium]